MVKLKLDGKVYEMVNNWDEVTIKQSNLLNLLWKEDITNLQKSIGLISILSGCPKDILLECDLDDIATIDISWCEEKMEPKFTNEIVIDGDIYRIKDVKSLKLGEYTDLDYYIQDAENNLHKIMAILIRKVGVDGELEKYNTEKMAIISDMFYEKLSITQTLGISNFFLNGESGYSENMKTSL